MTKHRLMGGKLRVYRRAGSPNWQCAARLDGRNYRTTTGEDSLAHAKDFAEDWYLGLRGKSRAGVLETGKRFREVAQQFLREYRVLTQGQRSERYIDRIEQILQGHLIPYFGDMPVHAIGSGDALNYRIHRANNGYRGKAPSRSTLHQEIVTLRQVLKTAQRHQWLKAIPDLSPPYKTSGKIVHRAWFSPSEYKKLYEATRQRAQNPLKKSWKWNSEQLHDYVLFMANTGLRPDEAARLEYRDVSIVKDEDSGERILEIEVRGKRGIGYCKSMTGAVLPFERLRKRNRAQPTALLFPNGHRQLFNAILEEEELKFDRDGNRRTAYSLRHTYICFRLMEGADIYQIAKNCRTSVEMIETYYASHIKNTLDAAAINVRRSRKKRAAPKKVSRKPTKVVKARVARNKATSRRQKRLSA